MNRVLTFVLGVMIGLFFVGFFAQSGISASPKKLPFPEVPRMTVKDLQSMPGRDDVTILDVRPLEQWEQSDQKIQGSVHEDPTKVDQWFHKYSQKEGIIVTY